MDNNIAVHFVDDGGASTDYISFWIPIGTILVMWDREYRVNEVNKKEGYIYCDRL